MAETASKTALAPVPVKAVEPQDLFERFDRIYDEIARRAFDIFETNGSMFGRELEDWLKAESEVLHPVHVKVTEADAAVTVEAEVPGFEAQDLDVKLEPRRLIISGKRESKEETKKGKTIFKEECSNQILRAIDLPVEVDAAKATATLKNGTLELQLPKSAKATTARVEVKAAQPRPLPESARSAS